MLRLVNDLFVATSNRTPNTSFKFMLILHLYSSSHHFQSPVLPCSRMCRGRMGNQTFCVEAYVLLLLFRDFSGFCTTVPAVVCSSLDVA